MEKLILIILVLSFVSCNDILEENPQDQLSDDFYETEEGIQTLINSAYEPVRGSNVFGGQYFLLTDIMADYAHGRGSTQPIGRYQGLDVTNQLRTALLWNAFYRSIRNANLAIERISEIQIIDESEKNEFIAEMRFMRAFYYYHLVRHWGAVPLYLDLAEGTPKGRTRVDEVYDAIISDLQYGENALPSTPSQFGRPSRWSAKALLAEVYLTTERWNLAKEKAAEVINSGQFGLIEVNEANDFNNIFGPNVNGSKEEIFYIKFNHDSGWGWPLNLSWPETEFTPFANYVIYSTSNPFFESWDDNDLRKKWNIFTEYVSTETGEVEQLPSSTPILTSKYRDPNTTKRYGYANDYPFLRYADVLLIYAEAANMDEGGPSDLALEYLNRIKRRAYGYPPNSNSPVDYPNDGWTMESFRDTVLQERAYELFMEGKRWLDLKRSGRLKATIERNTGFSVDDSHLFWPIPQDEIDTNTEITQDDQNPGY